MATDSARSGTQNLWQLPTLLIGIAALMGVWYARPYLRPTAAQRYERDLVQLRQLLEKAAPEPSSVRSLLGQVEGTRAPEQFAAQARFLRGSAHVVLAESAADRKEARDNWTLAREHLE